MIVYKDPILLKMMARVFLGKFQLKFCRYRALKYFEQYLFKTFKEMISWQC